MESLELRIFREVARLQSISKAAESMGYVQSNITAHIKKLEDELNTTLFIRHRKGVTLTADGEKLVYQANKIIALLDDTMQYWQGASTTLRIGTTQTISGFLLPKCIVDFQNQTPNISISVSILPQDEMEKQMMEETIDCIVTNSKATFASAKCILQEKEELVLIAPSDCDVIDDVWKYPLVINHIETCPYRKILLDWWNENQDDLPKLIELDSVEAILDTVELGGGISLLPKRTLLHRPHLTSFLIKDIPQTFIFVWVKEFKAFHACDAFIDIIKKYL